MKEDVPLTPRPPLSSLPSQSTGPACQLGGLFDWSRTGSGLPVPAAPPVFLPHVEKALGQPIQGAVALLRTPLSKTTLSWDVLSVCVSTGRSGSMFSAVRASALGFARSPAQAEDMTVLYCVAPPDGLLRASGTTHVHSSSPHSGRGRSRPNVHRWRDG